MKRVYLSLIRRKSLVLLLFTLLFLLWADAVPVYAKETQKYPYLIKVNRACNTVTIYEKGEDGKYSVPVKAMVCSVGTGTKTITGTFQTKAKYRWKALMGNVWGQYATRIVGGILFHSVYYYKNGNPATLATDEYNKLGTAASHGCVRLTVADAKWIYDNCAVGTTVIIYDDKKNPGPLGKPVAIKLPSSVRWDPTDPSSRNPYKNKTPKITGAKNLTADLGSSIDLLKGVKAKSTVGTDITSDLTIDGTVDWNKPGNYLVTYRVQDALGKEAVKKIKVTVSVNPSDVELTGIRDRIIKDAALIDEAFALNQVEAYVKNVKLDKKYIKASIEKTAEGEYTITYQVDTGSGALVTATSLVFVDSEPPVLTIQDMIFEQGELPTEEELYSFVTATDNYSKPENIVIKAKLRSNPEGTCTAVFTAVDEVGNSTVERREINN